MSRHTKAGRKAARRLHLLGDAIEAAWFCTERPDGSRAHLFCRWCLRDADEAHADGCAVHEMRRRYDAAWSALRRRPGVWSWSLWTALVSEVAA